MSARSSTNSAAPTRAAVQLVHMPTKLQSCSALLSAGDTSESIPWARVSALSMNTSIFCWAVVAASTYESALAMHTLRSCDDWLILSNASRLANGVHATQLFEGSLEVPRSRSYRTVLKRRSSSRPGATCCERRPSGGSTSGW